jgi:hypothetical protein
VKSFVEENYEPAGDPLVWRRKDLELDGGRRARPHRPVGRGATSVLVGRGWGAGERKRRPLAACGRRAAARPCACPCARPADLVVVVTARSEAAADARLGLVVNDQACGEQLSLPGWSDYTFRCRSRCGAGVNRVRLDHEQALAVEALRFSPPLHSLNTTSSY